MLAGADDRLHSPDRHRVLLCPTLPSGLSPGWPIRKKLAEQGIATVFNLLGPLLNPAGPTCQLTGVFSPTILEKYALALREVGRSRAWVVHGQILGGSGMDEISLLGETEVHEVKGNSLNQFY